MTSDEESYLARARRDNDMTQHTLAALANINRRTLVRLEQGGTPHEATARRLARVLGKAVEDLFTETTNIGRPPRPYTDKETP